MCSAVGWGPVKLSEYPAGMLSGVHAGGVRAAWVGMLLKVKARAQSFLADYTSGKAATINVFLKKMHLLVLYISNKHFWKSERIPNPR